MRKGAGPVLTIDYQEPTGGELDADPADPGWLLLKVYGRAITRRRPYGPVGSPADVEDQARRWMTELLAVTPV